jgi:GNAT superfamily N-acetyltransferase
MTKTAVRWADAKDASEIVRLVQALAIYEKEPVSIVKLTEADVLRDGFPPDGGAKRFECLLAELDGTPVGMALFFHNYSTWEGRAGLYVEDLFVEEHARGHGLGRALMAALARVAADRDCPRLDLNVLDWNPTRDFYHRIEMAHMADWLPYRMTRGAIAALAVTAPPINGDEAR